MLHVCDSTEFACAEDKQLRGTKQDHPKLLQAEQVASTVCLSTRFLRVSSPEPAIRATYKTQCQHSSFCILHAREAEPWYCRNCFWRTWQGLLLTISSNFQFFMEGNNFAGKSGKSKLLVQMAERTSFIIFASFSLALSASSTHLQARSCFRKRNAKKSTLRPVC